MSPHKRNCASQARQLSQRERERERERVYRIKESQRYGIADTREKEREKERGGRG